MKTQSYKNDTTLTPLGIIKELGDFELDPCAFKGHKTACKLVFLPKDGLSSKWKGRVWLNPPYSNPVPWLKKLVEHKNGIALVLASVETVWFHDLVWDKTEVQLMRPTCLVAYGKENVQALSKLKGKLLVFN